MATQLPVPDELKGFGGRGKSARYECPHFSKPAAVKHLRNAQADALVQLGTRRVKSNFHRVKSFERRASGAMHLSDPLARQHAYFNRANQLLVVARSNARSRLGVQTAKQTV